MIRSGPTTPPLDGHGVVDAVVVGGGPAGAVAAWALARRGWRTVLLERGDADRDKACGHCLSRAASVQLSRLGWLRDVRRLSDGDIDGVTIHFDGGGAPVAIDGAGGGGGLVVRRSRFDRWLRARAEEAGAEVRHGVAATRCTWGADGRARVAVRGPASCRTLEAALVVGADGAGSRVARAAGLARPRAGGGRRYGFSFDVGALDSNAVIAGRIHMFVVRGGYVGVVADRAGRLHVGGLVASRTGPMVFARRAAARFPATRGIGLDVVSDDAIDGRLTAGPMPWTTERVADHGVALVGDAAGYVEPFTGEGIAWSLLSARLLDATLARSEPGRWSASDAARYAVSWRREVGRRHRLCRALTAVLGVPAVPRLVTRGFLGRRLAARLAREVAWA